jgi:signal transduction histidine kinase
LTPPAPFRLLRWFASISALVIALSAAALSWALSEFLTERMFEQEATLTGDFIRNVLEADGSVGYLRDPTNPALAARFQATTLHFNGLRDALRINVYGRDRRLLWTNDPTFTLNGQEENDELDRALLGRTVIESGKINAELRQKSEHRGLQAKALYFIETYVPVSVSPGTPPDAVVEVYKAPVALTQAIHEGRRQISVVAGICTLALYLSLYGLVLRADRTIEEQQSRLREAEARALIGEMASSVAHNIRNPLASIRSSAELTVDSSDPLAASSSLNILKDVDRISSRVTELLHMTHEGPGERGKVPLGMLVRSCVNEMQGGFQQREQSLLMGENHVEASITWGDPLLLKQALHSVLSNAGEALPAGGRCEVEVIDRASQWCVRIRDNGPGITDDLKQHVFRAFFTTKPRGLGIGLPMARRIVEEMGGRLDLQSTAGFGTTVELAFPKA